MVIFVAEMLWIWHGVVGFHARRRALSRPRTAGRRTAANVITYMQTHVPPMIDQDQFQTGATPIMQVQYFSLNADGATTAFNTRCCAGLHAGRGQRQRHELSVLALLPAFSGCRRCTMPPFTTNLPMESAGFQDASGACVRRNEERIPVANTALMVASSDEHFREMVRDNLLNIPNAKIVAEYQEVAANLYIRVLQDLERNPQRGPDRGHLGRSRGRASRRWRR